MVPVFIWWVASTALGLLAFPLVRRIFNRLPDQGYGLSRAFSLLLSAYILWMGTSMGILRNNLGGTLGAVIVLGITSLAFGWLDRVKIWDWLRQNLRMILVVEVLFLVAFGCWSVVRAYDPAIQHTEQPMDLAFLNGILSSETFPPKDPWLSGYAISYYYFGYVLLAFMTRLTGVASSVAFNLGNALWFALSIVGAYSILINLISFGKAKLRIFAPLLGPLFLVLTGNLEVLFEILYYRQAFWKLPITPESTSAFWSWLNLERLVTPPLSSPTWIPSRHWWWWQASRVIYDQNLTGASLEMIDEFPFFSFLLADNHPHVLALPFALIAVSFALNVFHGRFDTSYRLSTIGQKIDLGTFWRLLAGLILAVGIVSGLSIILTGGEPSDAFQSMVRIFGIGSILALVLGIFGLIALGRFEVALPTKEFWIGAWIFGTLAFLNTWDFPFYLSLLFLVILWHQWHQGDGSFLKRFLSTGFGLTIAGVLVYLPWYPTFSSQAGGVLPNLIFPTRLVQFLIMFGPLILPIFIWLIKTAIVEHRIEKKGIPILVAVLIPLGLFLLSLLLGVAAYAVIKDDPVLSGDVFSHLGVLSSVPDEAFKEVMSAAFQRRLTNPGTVITLGAMLFFSTALLLRVKSKPTALKPDADRTWIFVILLIAIGTLLVLGPEFVYLKDQFGYRMNTIFKFYYATWIMWAIAAAYATIKLWPEKWNGLVVLRSLVILPLVIGLMYPVLAIWTKTNRFSSTSGPTLDGLAYLEDRNPGEYEAIQWIQDHLSGGVVAEAITIRSSYTGYARVSTYTSLAAVLGWPGHESQWRGGSEEQGARLSDIEKLYSTRSWQEAQQIVERYGIDYIYIGPLERSTYTPMDDRKFTAFMEPIFENGEVTIFATKEAGVNP